jgi:hypothetical protein
LARKDSFNRRIERQNLAIDAGFTNAAGDELSILGAEIKDYDNFVLRGWYQKENLKWRLARQTVRVGNNKLWIILSDSNNSRSDAR